MDFSALLKSKIFEVQGLIAVFLSLRPKLHNASQVIPKNSPLMVENKELSSKIEKTEDELFAWLPKIKPIMAGQYPSIPEARKMIEDIKNIYENINNSIKQTEEHLNKVFKATGYKITLDRPATLFRWEYYVIGGLAGILLLKQLKIL